MTWSAVSTHHLVDGAIEGIILCEDEQNNEGHIDMMRISVLHMVKDLQDGQHLRGRQGEQEKGVEHVLRHYRKSQMWHSLNPDDWIPDSDWIHRYYMC